MDPSASVTCVPAAKQLSAAIVLLQFIVVLPLVHFHVQLWPATFGLEALETDPTLQPGTPAPAIQSLDEHCGAGALVVPCGLAQLTFEFAAPHSS